MKETVIEATFLAGTAGDGVYGQGLGNASRAGQPAGGDRRWRSHGAGLATKETGLAEKYYGGVPARRASGERVLCGVETQESARNAGIATVTLLVNLAPVGDREHRHYLTFIIDRVDDPPIADAVASLASQSPASILMLLCRLGSRSNCPKQRASLRATG